MKSGLSEHKEPNKFYFLHHNNGHDTKKSHALK